MRIAVPLWAVALGDAHRAVVVHLTTCGAVLHHLISIIVAVFGFADCHNFMVLGWFVGRFQV